MFDLRPRPAAADETFAEYRESRRVRSDETTRINKKTEMRISDTALCTVKVLKAISDTFRPPYLLTRETVDLDPRVLRVEVARLEARHIEAGCGKVVEGTAHRLLG